MAVVCGSKRGLVEWAFHDMRRNIYHDRPDCKDLEEVEEVPIGSPKPQTVASKKYQDKAGWISKTYKLKRETVEMYAEACQRAGVSAAGQLTKIMMEFAKEQHVI